MTSSFPDLKTILKYYFSSSTRNKLERFPVQENTP
jgi:hypothetical protein